MGKSSVFGSALCERDLKYLIRSARNAIYHSYGPSNSCNLTTIWCDEPWNCYILGSEGLINAIYGMNLLQFMSWFSNFSTSWIQSPPRTCIIQGIEKWKVTFKLLRELWLRIDMVSQLAAALYDLKVCRRDAYCICTTNWFLFC